MKCRLYSQTDFLRLLYLEQERPDLQVACIKPGAHIFIISFTNEGKEGMKTNAYNSYAFSVKKKERIQLFN